MSNNIPRILFIAFLLISSPGNSTETSDQSKSLVINIKSESSPLITDTTINGSSTLVNFSSVSSEERVIEIQDTSPIAQERPKNMCCLRLEEFYHNHAACFWIGASILIGLGIFYLLYFEHPTT